MTLGQGKAASSKGWCSAYSFIYTHLTKKMMYQCNKMRINESAHFNSQNGITCLYKKKEILRLANPY